MCQSPAAGGVREDVQPCMLQRIVCNQIPDLALEYKAAHITLAATEIQNISCIYMKHVIVLTWCMRMVLDNVLCMPICSKVCHQPGHVALARVMCPQQAQRKPMGGHELHNTLSTLHVCKAISTVG